MKDFIEEEENLDEEIDLDNLFDKASKITTADKTTKTIAKDNSFLVFEIKETDDVLTSSMKTLINSKKINTQYIYDYKGQQDGYNMIYALRKEQLGIKRFLEWCSVLFVKPKVIFTNMSEDEIKINKKLLAKAKNKVRRKNNT